MKLLLENWREFLNENNAIMSEDEWINFMENEFEERLPFLTQEIFINYVQSRISETRVMPSMDQVREWYDDLRKLTDPDDRSHVPEY